MASRIEVNARAGQAGRAVPVEVLESLVRTYLVRRSSELELETGQRIELVIGDNPPVACTVAGFERGDVRLTRGWALESA